MYEGFYKLHGRPFQLAPDPRVFFASRGHKRALSYLQYGIEQGEGFIVVTGDVGAGKTTLIRALTREVSRNEVVVGQVESTQLGPDDLLRRIASTFNVQGENVSKAQLLKNIEAFLRQQEANSRRVLLIIDEAQNLAHDSLEELRMLSNLQVRERALMQCFLLGQPEFRAILQAPELEQLSQRVIASYHLGPLESDEVKRYVECRLGFVSWRGDPRFSDDAFAIIHEFTGGIPRRINILCDRLLLYGYLESIHDIDATTVRAVVDELRGERGGDATVRGGAGNGALAPASPDAMDVRGIEKGLLDIEQRLAKMERALQKEFSVLRKAIVLTMERQKEHERAKDSERQE